MSVQGRERFNQMSKAYDAVARVMVPQYDFLQFEAIKLLPYPSDERLVLVDIGAGSGILLEKLLTHYPRAIGYYVDYSPEFREVAEFRLARFKARVSFITAAFSSPWMEKIMQPVDAVFSMSALHHLDAVGKKQIYRQCHALLKPGGWLINIDEMKTDSEAAYHTSLRFWSDHVDRVMIPDDPGKAGDYKIFKAHFENWKKRNIANAHELKKPGDDMHDPFLEQEKWLREIGFLAVDCFVKYHLWCILGGYKSF